MSLNITSTWRVKMPPGLPTIAGATAFFQYSVLQYASCRYCGHFCYNCSMLFAHWSKCEVFANNNLKQVGFARPLII